MRDVHFTILLASLKFATRGQVTDVLTYVKCLVNWFRGYGVLISQNCHFPLTCCIALTTVCTTVRHCDYYYIVTVVGNSDGDLTGARFHHCPHISSCSKIHGSLRS